MASHDPLDALPDPPALSGDAADDLFVHSSVPSLHAENGQTIPSIDTMSSARHQAKASFHSLSGADSPLHPHEAALDPLSDSIKAGNQEPAAEAAAMSSLASVSLDDGLGLAAALPPVQGHSRVPSAVVGSQQASSTPRSGYGSRGDSPAASRGRGNGSIVGDDVSTALLSPAAALLDDMAEPGSLQAGADLKVWVKDPERVEATRMGVKYTSFYTFVVRSEAPGMQGFGREAVEARRRFSDFDALHRLLKAHHRGYFVPPLPDKAFFEANFTARDSFLKVRRVDLQAFMRSVASHPVLRGSEELRLFLTAQGDLAHCGPWQQMLARPAAAEGLRGIFAHASGAVTPPNDNSPRSAGSGESSGGLAPGLMMRVKHSFMGMAQRSKPRQEVPEDEGQLRQAKEWLRELQQHLQAACHTARSVVQHMEGVCEDWGDLGKSYAHMARFEEGAAQRNGQYTAAGRAAAQRASDLQHMGYALLRQHAVWKQFAMRTAASLVFLHDYYVLVPEAIAALEEREAALSSVQLLQEELREKQVLHARAQDGHDSKRTLQLAATVHQLQERIKAAQAHYEMLKQRNTDELARLNLERAADYRRCLTHFAEVQVQLSRAAAEVWSSVAEQLKATV